MGKRAFKNCLQNSKTNIYFKKSERVQVHCNFQKYLKYFSSSNIKKVTTILRVKELSKTVFKILKPIYISRSQNAHKFNAISKNIFSIFLAQILRKLQVLEDSAVFDYKPPFSKKGITFLIFELEKC